MTKAKDEFMKGKHGIGWVDSSFTREFGDKEINLTEPSLTAHTLQRSMVDSDILKELSIQECTLSEVLAMILNPTPEMKDGYANLFYIKGHPSRVVYVYWFDGGWFVRGWRRDDYGWFEGKRVFSPATDALSSSTKSSDSLTLETAIKICKENGLEVIKKM